MRINKNIFWILFVFFWVVAVLYSVWNIIDHGYVEWVGTVALALSGILGALIGFYVGATRRAQGGVLPEDRIDADIDDGDPEIGYFSPWSWWPMLLALGTSLAFLGFAVGIWLCFIGIPIALLSVLGWYYEYYRNNFAR
ncbi:cytochrome c oxidase subunit 4 [soil metagenome]